MTMIAVLKKKFELKGAIYIAREKKTRQQGIEYF